MQKTRWIIGAGGLLMAGVLGVALGRGPLALGEKPPAPWKRTVVQVKTAPAPVGPYSQAVRIGPWVFMAGQIAIDPSTQRLVKGGIEAQTVRVMENIEAILAAVGGDLKDLVQVTVFLKDLEDFPRFNQVYARYVGTEPPARATVGVSALPAGAAVEITAVAYVPTIEP